MAYVQQLLKGLIDPIILSIINRLPMYGYQVVKELEQITSGYLKLKSGTVYPDLMRLEKKGLVTSKWEKNIGQRGRRYYKITDRGQQFLAKRLSDWKDFYIVINKLMQETNS